jgi:predicted signal transduction protein with EAL and GGDEF domain
MGVLTRTREAFSVGDTADPLGRSLLVEQLRMVRQQVPVLYAVLLVDSISVGLVLPSTVSGWLRFTLPACLLAVCLLRLIQWLRMRGAEFTPDDAHHHLTRTRRVAVVLNAGFVVWIQRYSGR